MNAIYFMLTILGGNITHTIAYKLMSIEFIYMPHFKIESGPSGQRGYGVMYVDRMIPKRRGVSPGRSDLSRSLFQTSQKMPLICNFTITQIIYNFPFTVKILAIFDPLAPFDLADYVYCFFLSRERVETEMSVLKNLREKKKEKLLRTFSHSSMTNIFNL